MKTEDGARTLQQTVVDGDGSGPLALRRVLELVAFSYLIGNGDLHGKNFSARCDPAGLWELTPVYDVLSTQPYLSWRDPMALDLYERANRLTRTHLLDAARRLGLQPRALARALDRICGRALEWAPRIGEIGLDERSTQRLTELVQQRLVELRG